MSSFGHYGDGRGMGGTDFPEIPKSIEQVEKEMEEKLKPKSSQLFRDKTDAWDLRDEHKRGLHEESPIPEHCRSCKSELFDEPRSVGRLGYNSHVAPTSGFLQIVCKECREPVGTGSWSYCLKHRCMWNSKGRLGDQSAEHLLGSNLNCPNCVGHNKNQRSVETKQTNPKDIIGSDKVPMGLVPGVTIAYAALGHMEGLLKYGAWNWREAGVRTSIYLDALMRHIQKFKDGEWADPKTQVPHLANALACISIIIDAYHTGKLIDDRPKSVNSAKVIDELSSVVKHLKELHGDCKPVDYFIEGPKQR